MLLKAANDNFPHTFGRVVAFCVLTSLAFCAALMTLAWWTQGPTGGMG